MMSKFRFFLLIFLTCFAVSYSWAEIEPNDSCATPEIILTSGSTSGTVVGSSQSPDKDVFAFELDSPGDLAVTLYNTGTAKDLKYSFVSISCPTATQTLVKGNSIVLNASSTASSATYYLVVEGAVTNQATPYSIAAIFTPLNVADTALTITKAGPADIMPEEYFSYTIDVTNTGSVDAYDVHVNDTLPSGVTFRPSTGCTDLGGVVTCSLGTMTPGEVASVTLNVAGPGVSADGTTIVNTATATASNAPQVTSNSVNTDIHKPDLGCANPADYRSVYSQNIAGEVDIVGNSVMCMNNGGVCGDPGTAANNNINMMYVDGDSDPTTYNSSSARVLLPSGSEVLWAGLYWQGMLTTDGSGLPGPGTVREWQTASASVRIAPPGGGYSTVSARVPDHNWVYVEDSLASSRWYYQGHADVTAIVQAGGDGYYSVANIVSRTGQPNGGSFGAWSLVLVYKNLNLGVRNLAVYNGYMGVMGGSLTSPMSGDPLKAFNYASHNSCSTAVNTLGVANQVLIPLTGFKTPQSNDVNASFAIFSGEGDIGLTGDRMFLQDKSGLDHSLTNAVNPATNVQNATISKRGIYVNTLEPQATYAGGTPWRNSLGIDIDFYDASAILNNDQTSTVVTLNSNGDGYFPGVFAFSTELYNPHFCYDYTYEQYDRDFTENNDGSSLPRIVGDLLGDGPIDVRVYLKNQEESDVIASDLIISIEDIDTNEATYERETTYVAEAGQITRKAIPDSSISVGDSFIKGVPMGDMAGSESAWVYYTLTPGSGVDHVNMPLRGELRYTLSLPDGAGGYINIDRNETLGHEMPLCVDSGFVYKPAYGRFNIEYKPIFSTSPLVAPKYDIPTQVVQRPDAFKIASYDINGTVYHPHTRKYDVNTSVAVEMISLKGYHDTDAACEDPASAISERVWVEVINGVADFNGSVIDVNSLSAALFPSRDFVGKAQRKAAFRISYNVIADKGDLVKTSYITSGAHAGNVAINNFTELAQGLEDYNSDLPPADQNKCVQPVVSGNKTYTTMPEACGNASATNGISREQLHICMECVYGSQVEFACSRDNFAIRPESFSVKLNDQNQTDSGEPKIRFANDRTAVTSPITDQVFLASGYKYDLDINATSHYGNDAVPGYTQPYSYRDVNLTLIWDPDVAQDVSGCHDYNSYALTFNMIHGQGDLNLSLAQVGEYRLNMIDSNWTAVDWDSRYMQHQLDDSTHFFTGNDCVRGTSVVPSIGAPVTTTPVDMQNVVGCNITTSNHNNTHSNENAQSINVSLSYRDYNLRFYPYAFSLEANASFGIAANTNWTNAWVYMSDVNGSNMEMNQSVHVRGSIHAVGRYGTKTNNFVKNCYAEPINLYLYRSMPTLPNLPIAFKYHLLDINASNVAYFVNSPTVIADLSGDLNLSDLIAEEPTLTDGNFTYELNGTTVIDLSVNFDRKRNQPINPLTVTYTEFNVSCANPSANCVMQAEMTGSHQTVGKLPIGNALTHYYGRLHAPRYRIEGNTGDVTLYYEVYCDQAPVAGDINVPNPCSLLLPTDHDVTMPNRILSVDDIRWYQNEAHVESEGNTTGIVQRRNTYNEVTETDLHFDAATPNLQKWTMQYNEAQGYPFKATMEMTTDSWLLYDRFNPMPSTNSFELEFNSAGQWAGENAGNIAVDSDASVNTNRRIEW